MGEGGAQHHLWVEGLMSHENNPKRQRNVRMRNAPIHASWRTNFSPKKGFDRRVWRREMMDSSSGDKDRVLIMSKKKKRFWVYSLLWSRYTEEPRPLSACILGCWLDSWHSHSSNSAWWWDTINELLDVTVGGLFCAAVVTGSRLCSCCENEVESTANWIIECHFFALWYSDSVREYWHQISSLITFSCKLFAQKESESIVQWTTPQCIVKDLTNCVKNKNKLWQEQ